MINKDFRKWNFACCITTDAKIASAAFKAKMRQFFNIFAPRPHTSDKTFILHPNYHFDIEKQDCQISFLKNK